MTAAVPTRESLLTKVTDLLSAADAAYGAQIEKMIAVSDDRFHQSATEFLSRYQCFIEAQGKSLEFGIRSFMRLRTDMAAEWLEFKRSGKYTSSSFAEVEQRVYATPEVMQRHMHGLVFAQFLWPEQYRRYTFFADHLKEFAGEARNYLEVGGGHALYIVEAVKQLPQAQFDLLDISKSSIELAQGIAADLPIDYHLQNIMDFHPEQRYDFITMGEVLEHLEDPAALLKRVRELMADDGHAYITTPVNAPMIDHIYLFNDAEEIRGLFRACGLEIEKEVTQYALDMPENRAKALKVPLMFGAFVRRH
jgi:2-polyprenyl-3-methyl-5-hydroxy-6-metoxy-1,4-benzoquinol methylase